MGISEVLPLKFEFNPNVLNTTQLIPYSESGNYISIEMCRSTFDSATRTVYLFYLLAGIAIILLLIMIWRYEKLAAKHHALLEKKKNDSNPDNKE